jgi:hypothetical protein
MQLNRQLCPVRHLRGRRLRAYNWADSKHGAAKSACAYAFAVLLTPGAEARASCDLTVGPSQPPPRRAEPGEPDGTLVSARLRHGGGGSDLAPCLGSSTFVKTSKLEESTSPYVHDDCLRIECVITVFKFRKASRSPAAAVPTPSLSQDLVRLLETTEGADLQGGRRGFCGTRHRARRCSRRSCTAP